MKPHLLAGTFLLLIILSGCATRQEYIHDRGTIVMPFDLSSTTHVFQVIENGGLQQVTVKNSSDLQNIILIQEHLAEISEEFAKGNFSDPKMLHGDDMPGVSILEEKYEALSVSYTPLDNGAQILYSSSDPEVVQAIHDWFDAQLMDHGADATGEFNSSVCDEVPEGHPADLWRLHHGC
ncbi:MAG: aspartate carbamoyltransferase [Nanoarchaeota archaeon]|nr:aspartate carbamoyltransferase [Nanoarchaeota archaeon]